MSIKEKVQKMVNHFYTTTKEMSRENSLSRFTGNADTEESDEHNRNFSEVLEVNNEEISYNCSSTIERQKEKAITREEYRRIENVVSQVGDNFDEIFAIENTPNSELENQIVEEIKENFIDGYAMKKNDEEIKQEEEEKHLIIDDIKIVTEVVKTGVQQSQTVTNENTPHLREYNNKPKFYKPVFGKAKTGENNLKKYLFMIISSVVVIVITGVLGNVIAEGVLKLFKIEEPIAKGIAIGSSSHAVGTAKAMEIGPVEGAMSSLSIVVCGLLTVIGASLFSVFIPSY